MRAGFWLRKSRISAVVSATIPARLKMQKGHIPSMRDCPWKRLLKLRLTAIKLSPDEQCE
jgi:hypothetical protein